MLCCFLCCLKQKWSVCLLTLNSVLLFLSGTFMIYISICLYHGTKPFGSDDGATEEQQELSLDSYLIIFSILTGCFGILLALSGCCTARTKDKCSVGFFSFLAFIFFCVFLAAGCIMMVLYNNEEQFIDKFCSASGESLRADTEDLNTIQELAYDLQDITFNDTRIKMQEIDKQLNDGMKQYMCRKECPCDPRGKLPKIQNRWPESVRKEFGNKTLYNFDGEITNYYQCYQKLVRENKVAKVDKQLMLMIQDFEKNLQCLGFCYTPKFWFFLDFFEGPPKQNCLKSIRDQFKNTDGYLGYSLMGMAVFTLFQLFSICGICRSSDKSFQQDREANVGREAVYLNEEKDQFRSEVGDNSSNGRLKGMNYQQVEMPERAQRFQIRQRNYEID